MIRFVDLSAIVHPEALLDELPHGPFAFLDTVGMRFVELDEQQVFDDYEDFERAMVSDSGFAAAYYTRMHAGVPEKFKRGR